MQDRQKVKAPVQKTHRQLSGGNQLGGSFGGPNLNASD
jgi:hypothetical protein